MVALGSHKNVFTNHLKINLPLIPPYSVKLLLLSYFNSISWLLPAREIYATTLSLLPSKGNFPSKTQKHTTLLFVYIHFPKLNLDANLNMISLLQSKKWMLLP